SQWGDEPSRREFLKVMAASLALAGLNGCRGQRVDEKVVPYVQQPPELVPGKPLYFATAMTLGGLATGVLVESHMGRPIKIEGNPKHPATPPSHWGGDEAFRPGACDVFSQAAVLGLYDPDRSQTPVYLSE